MPDRSAAYASPATVHSWIPDRPTLRFNTLKQALEHCKEHIDQLPTIEVFVHTGDVPEPIISGDELEFLLGPDKLPLKFSCDRTRLLNGP